MTQGNTPWTHTGDDSDWDTPVNARAEVCGSCPIYDASGDLVAFAVNVGWNDKDSERRDAIITAVNSYASSQAEIARLQLALVAWVNAAEMLADEPGMDAHFHDVADSTLDVVTTARASISEGK